MIKTITCLSCALVACNILADNAPAELPAMHIKALNDNAATMLTINSEPVSKTAFYGQELIERGITNQQHIANNVPNFTINTQGIGAFRQISTLRGLSNTALYSEPASVVYVDDVAYNSAMTTLGFLFDIDELAIYRDPQPARFGKNAYAGGVDIHTRKPSRQLTGGINLNIASYDNYLVTAKSAGALIKDSLLFNISGVYQTNKGFLTNNFLNNHPNAQENFSGRAALTYKPNHAWQVDLNLIKEDFNYGNARFVRLDAPTQYTTYANLSEQLKQSSDTQSLRIRNNNANYDLMAITSHRYWQLNPLVVDLDLTPSSIARRDVVTFNETWTQELRLSSKLSTPWHWQLNGFYSNTDFNYHDNLTTSAVYDRLVTQKSTDNFALGTHIDYQGFNNINFYQEVRLDYVQSHLQSNLVRITQGTNYYRANTQFDSLFISPKWGVDYYFIPNGAVYFSTGFGAKAAGLAYANPDWRFVSFKQENLWHNTLGIKTSWFNERLKSNLAAFYYQIENYQIERNLANGNYTVFNAPQVSSYGFELEHNAQLFNNVYLEHTLGYTHSRIDKYRDIVTGSDYKGNQLPFVPEMTMMTAVQYKNPRGYFARAQWTWRSKTYFDETQNEALAQNAYSLINLRIGYEKRGYSLYLYADNVSDSYYYTSKVSNRGAVGNPCVLGAQVGYAF